MSESAVIEPNWIANCCCFCGQVTVNGVCPDHDLMTMHDCDAGNPPGWLNDVRCANRQPFTMTPPPEAKPFDPELRTQIDQQSTHLYWMRSRRHG